MHVLLIHAMPLKEFFFSLKILTQQIFVLIKTLKTLLRSLLFSPSKDVFKTSLRRLDQDEYIRLKSYVFRRSLQDVLIKTNIFILAIHLEDIFKTSLRCLTKTFSRRFPIVFKTSCKRVFKTSSRCLQDVSKTSSRRLQDIFKTFSRVSSG